MTKVGRSCCGVALCYFVRIFVRMFDVGHFSECGMMRVVFHFSSSSCVVRTVVW